MRHVARTKEQL